MLFSCSYFIKQIESIIILWYSSKGKLTYHNVFIFYVLELGFFQRSRYLLFFATTSRILSIFSLLSWIKFIFFCSMYFIIFGKTSIISSIRLDELNYVLTTENDRTCYLQPLLISENVMECEPNINYLFSFFLSYCLLWGLSFFLISLMISANASPTW